MNNSNPIFNMQLPSGNVPGNAQVPIFSNQVDLGQVGEGVLNSMLSRVDTLRINELQPGQLFMGIVWVTETRSVVNRFNPNTYDITYYFYDGNGVYYTAKRWGTSEHVSIEETPGYVSGTKIQV